MSEMDVVSIFEGSDEIRPLVELIHNVIEIPEEEITDNSAAIVFNTIEDSLTPKLKQMSVDNVVKNFTEENLTLAQAAELVEEVKKQTLAYIETFNPSEKKKDILSKVLDIFFDIFDRAIIQYEGYDIVLPILLEEGAKVPTYAHDTDAAADLFANEDIIIKAHSLGNMVHTGVKIGLPEGWRATILPRSSTGLKTPLRLSNSQGLIDSDYRGEVMLLFDNISDSDFTIKRGDKLAQLEVKPIYRFKAKIVESLDETERGEGGFGSTGK